MEIKNVLCNNKAKPRITCIYANIDPKMVSKESYSMPK